MYTKLCVQARVKPPPYADAPGMGLIAAEGGDLWPVALYAGCRPYHRALKLEGLRGASRLSSPSRPAEIDSNGKSAKR